MKKSKDVTDDFRFQIIQEYLAGASKYSLKKKYNLCDCARIRQWMIKFGIEDPNPPLKSFKDMSKTNESSEIAELQKQIKQLKASLAQSNMKVDVLDTMITLAEKKFQIPIRKKSGTKQ